MARSGRHELRELGEVNEIFVGDARSGKRGRGAEVKPLFPLLLRKPPKELSASVFLRSLIPLRNTYTSAARSLTLSVSCCRGPIQCFFFGTFLRRAL